MLGLGRALGETMAVAMVLSASPVDHAQHDLQHQPGHHRLQHRLELRRGDARTSWHVLIATGLVLFVVHLRGQLRRPRDRRRAASGSSTR